MHHQIWPRLVKHVAQRARVEHVRAHVTYAVGEGCCAEARRRDVEGCDGVAICGEECRDDFTAEEAAAACYENVGAGHWV